MILAILALISAIVLVLEGTWIIVNPVKARQTVISLLKHPNTLRLLGCAELAMGLIIATYVLRTPLF